MANTCTFSMSVLGRPEDLNKFIEIMKANYDEKEKDCPKHMWRTQVLDTEITEVDEDNLAIGNISGECAWSVHSCMRDGAGSYQSNYPNGRGTTLLKESKVLNLVIEVYSEEPGMLFQEHYLYANGEELINDCIDIVIYDSNDYNNVEEFNAAANTHFTKEEFDAGIFYVDDGFDWEFNVTSYKDYILPNPPNSNSPLSASAPSSSPSSAPHNILMYSDPP